MKEHIVKKINDVLKNFKIISEQIKWIQENKNNILKMAL